MGDRAAARAALERAIAELAEQIDVADDAIETAQLQHEAHLVQKQAELERLQEMIAGLKVALAVVEPTPVPSSPPPPPSPPPAPSIGAVEWGICPATNDEPGAMLSFDRLAKGLHMPARRMVTFPGRESVKLLNDTGWNGPRPLYNVLAERGLTPSISLPLGYVTEASRSLPDVRGAARPVDFDAGLRGEWDDELRRFCERLKAAGHADPVFRIGWEAGGDFFGWWVGHDFFGFDDERTGQRWKALFRHNVTIIRSVLPNARINWCHFKDPMVGESGTPNRKRIHYDFWYPGDDVVDEIGLDIYDGDCDPNFAARMNDSKPGTGPGNKAVQVPRHPAAFLTYARSKGKKLSFPEMGIRVFYDRKGLAPEALRSLMTKGDNPAFWRTMVPFIWEHRADIADACLFHRYQHIQYPLTRNGTRQSTDALIEELDRFDWGNG